MRFELMMTQMEQQETANSTPRCYCVLVECPVLGYNALLFVESQSMFRRNKSLLSSGLKSK